MNFLIKTLMVLVVSLLIMSVGMANNATLTRAKVFPTDVASRLKRAVLRSSVAKTVFAGVATILLTTSAYGDGGGSDNGVSNSATEAVASQSGEKRHDLLSLYFGRGHSYMSESTGAFTTKIDGLEYDRLGDYYGLPTTMDERIEKFVGGLGAHLGTTGIEVKFFLFGGTNRVNSGVYYPDPNDGKIFKDSGNMPNIIFAGTRELFGINAQRGLVGIGDEAFLTFHLGPSLNIHPVTGTIISQVPSKTIQYALKDGSNNTDTWTEKGHSQHLTEISVGSGGHIGPALLWQVNLNLKNFIDRDFDEVGGGLGLSYVGTVTHNGIHTHLLMLRLSLNALQSTMQSTMTAIRNEISYQ